MKKANPFSTKKRLFFLIGSLVFITLLTLIILMHIKENRNPAPSSSIQETSVTITNKGFIPNEITIQRWQNTRILIKNMEGHHNFILEKYGIKTRMLQPGESIYVYFYASAPFEYPGGYRFYSDSGDGHGVEITGLLNVL
ncbi:hypothetical protein A3D77_08160 [Candidatus Gottesmanbacteria bacterium RIFCSPHIGHO2_02_FULL_39_11]|uniref:EfeO-type cupredoxin-like domain-containing protein n=1 Tax=Candidatus Gottesmanbacteria bacterium RIFCSPHIGHO2_02_FULL_39_11 TaxID=1798382 RepID=A0A1F5ZW45_9BACT|nr:MAG: hypothetical protein A3D77_08160 [Candidatus Gottesmanbacteria bacterium RIFCSPHIGHO2_02_FULL_39_11]